MSLTTQTYWIDRLFYSNSKQGLAWEIALIRSKTAVAKKLKEIYNHPVFEKSLFLRNISDKLKLTGLRLEQYKIFKGTGASIGLIMGTFIYLLSISNPLSLLMLLIPLLTLMGFSLVDWYVLDKEQEISYRIHHEFPRFMDLLHLYTASAAYENIGSAMYAIANTMHGALAKQLQELTAVQRFVDTDKFLDEFSTRIKTPLAKDLVSTLRLTEVYGGNISEKIGLLAEEAHKSRMQNAKKQGQRSSAALLIPLMLFHFPVAIIIFLAPTALALQKVFGW